MRISLSSRLSGTHAHARTSSRSYKHVCERHAPQTQTCLAHLRAQMSPLMIDDLFVLSPAFLLFLNWRKTSLPASARSAAKCCALEIFGRGGEPAKVGPTCCMSHFTFSLTLSSGGTEASAEQRIRPTFVLFFNQRDRTGWKSHTPTYHFHIDTRARDKGEKKNTICYCASAQEGCVGKSKHCSPILFGTVCPVVSGPKLLNTHMQTHTRLNHAICATSRRRASPARSEDPNRCALVWSWCRRPRRLWN